VGVSQDAPTERLNMAANLVSGTIAADDGDNVPLTSSGTYTFQGMNNEQTFILMSDTAGLVTGTTKAGTIVEQYIGVGKGGVTVIKYVSVNLTITRAALPTAVLTAIPI